MRRYPTPAQVYGHPTLDDVPVAGPTDPGILQADCWFAQTVLPQPKPRCADCTGPVPGWAKTKGVGLDGVISRGGRAVVGFGAVGDPDIWSDLSPDQQNWVRNALNDLNTNIQTENPGNACATWAPDYVSMTKCFHDWWNKHYGNVKTLRTDGAFDADTLNALRGIVIAADPKEFPSLPASGYPADVAAAPTPATSDSTPAAAQPTAAPVVQAASVAPSVIAPAPAKHGEEMSTGAKVGIAVAGAAVLGSIIYAASGSKKRKR